ncbi:MAG: TIGR03621 family F420-dependent LLM class oxidoreductase [Acidimicrobiales bacterium]
MSKPFRFTVQASHLAAPEDVVPIARKCEDIGVSVLTVADHVDDQLAPIAALMAVADRTTVLRVGSLVLANDYRHPAILAKEMATIDRLSGGRLEFGLGAGWMTSDYDSTGLALDRPGLRIERLEESLEIISGLWSDQPVDFTGSHYRITALDGQPKPLQKPRPPIIVGGGGRRVLELAGRQADIVALNPSLRAGVIDARAGTSATWESTEEKIGWVRTAAGERFANLELATRIHLAAVTSERDGLYEGLAEGFGMTAAQARRTPHALVGTVDQIIDDLLERRDGLGISNIGISAGSLDELRPVIEALAGT